MPSLKEALELWRIIDQRLSSSELQTCKSLLNDLMSNRRERNQVHTSLGRLFKKDDYLHQRFTQLFPYGDYDNEDQDGKIQEDSDVEEGEIREEDQQILRDDHPNIDHQAVAMANDEIRVTDIEEGEIREEDRLRDDPEIYQAHKKTKKIDLANHEMRVKVDEKHAEEEEDVMYVSPSYRLLEEKEEESSVSERVLMKFDAKRDNTQTRYEKAMAKCEDENEMNDTDMLIESVRSAIRSVQKVLNEEMRFEDLGASFYSFIKKSLHRDRDTVKEYNLPTILTRLEQKEKQLKDDRNSKKI